MPDQPVDKGQRGLPALNLSMVISVEPAKISIESIDLSALKGDQLKFVQNLRDSKRVLYDWGCAVFYTCSEPYTLDRNARTITPNRESGKWVGVNDHDIKDIVGNAWSGEWSPIAADSLLAMLNSGIEVDLVNTDRWGPEDPVEFIERLKSMLSSST